MRQQFAALRNSLWSSPTFSWKRKCSDRDLVPYKTGAKMRADVGYSRFRRSCHCVFRSGEEGGPANTLCAAHVAMSD